MGNRYFCNILHRQAMAEHNELGSWGESYAREYLEKSGYIVLEHDWRSARGGYDVDIICKTPDCRTMVFVEVKTRATNQIVSPEDAVDRRKIRFLGRVADEYVKTHNVVEELRFDIIAIVGRKGSAAVQINHIEDAFNPLLL